MTAEALDDFLERRAAQLQESHAQLAREILAGGQNVTLSDRQVGYILGLLAGKDDSVAESIRELLDPRESDLDDFLEQAVAASGSSEEAAEEDVPAGQDPDVTSWGFWYGSSTRNQPGHVRLIGAVGALLRGKRR